MDKIVHIQSVDEYCKSQRVETMHPLVSIIDYSQRCAFKHSEKETPTHMHWGIYGIFLKDGMCGEIEYGRGKYDYTEGSMIFISPGQVMKIKPIPGVKTSSKALIFHPDLILGTPLAKAMNDYHFFSYESKEALHLSERERQLILESFEKITYETEERIDKYTKKLIVSNIQILLDYCVRFYDRQFITRQELNKGTLEKFETELNTYFKSEKPQNTGLPSVAYFADILHLSSNYFGDLIKKETGKSAQEYIQFKLINIAKNRILDLSKPISEVAYELGFKYPQHFTRMFKKSVGMSPSEYRDELN
jgi:AraC-like DNA-binding protein